MGLAKCDLDAMVYTLCHECGLVCLPYGWFLLTMPTDIMYIVIDQLVLADGRLDIEILLVPLPHVSKRIAEMAYQNLKRSLKEPGRRSQKGETPGGSNKKPQRAGRLSKKASQSWRGIKNQPQRAELAQKANHKEPEKVLKKKA